jgi:hypothetical protein
VEGKSDVLFIAAMSKRPLNPYLSVRLGWGFSV